MSMMENFCAELIFIRDLMQEGFAFSHCTTCKAQFHLRVESFEDNSWHKLKFRLFVARDVLLVFLAVQTVSGMPTFFPLIYHHNGQRYTAGWAFFGCVVQLFS